MSLGSQQGWINAILGGFFSHWGGAGKTTVLVLFAKKVHTCDLVYPYYLINFGIRSRIQMQNEKEKQNTNTEIDAHTHTPNVTKNITTPHQTKPIEQLAVSSTHANFYSLLNL